MPFWGNTKGQMFRQGIAHAQFRCKHVVSPFLVMVVFEALTESFSILSTGGSPLGGISSNLSTSTVTVPSWRSFQNVYPQNITDWNCEC